MCTHPTHTITGITFFLMQFQHLNKGVDFACKTRQPVKQNLAFLNFSSFLKEVTCRQVIFSFFLLQSN